jgi:hypothetical protein
MASSRFISIYAEMMLQILKEANGAISHADATLRFKNKLFPRATRTAGTVKLAEDVLTHLVAAQKIDRQQIGVVRTYSVRR